MAGATQKRWWRVSTGCTFCNADLQKIVVEDGKQRCSFNEDGTLIYLTLMN